MTTQNSNSRGAVYINTGNGQFSTASYFGVWYGPYSLAIGDLNGDGKPDIVTGNFTSNVISPLGDGSTISIVPNNGGGNFGAPITTAAEKYPYAVDIGDMNGDGKPDLVVANRTRGFVSVYFNLGNFQFGPPVKFGTGYEPVSIVVKDFNGDGYQDVATANLDDRSASVLLNNGTGKLGSSVKFLVPGQPSRIVSGDLNGDGRPDLITALYTGNTGNTAYPLPDSVAVLYSLGSDGFKQPVKYGVPEYPEAAIADVNSDGRLDILTANHNNHSVSVLLNQGNEHFSAPTSFSTGSRPQLISVADLNGDKKPDLVVEVNLGVSKGDYAILFNNGQGGFGSPFFYTSDDYINQLFLEDLNRDGYPDLILTGASTTVRFNTGQGVFGNPVTLINTEGPILLGMNDVNGDGYLDLIVGAFNTNNLYIHLGKGDSSFNPPVITRIDPNGSVYNNPYGTFACGDFNSDGLPDLAMIYQQEGTLWIMLNKGNGQFGAAKSFYLGVSGISLSSADYNQDGQIDLAYTDVLSGTISVLYNNQFCRINNTQKSGVWNDPTVWSCGRIPDLTDYVRVLHPVTIPASYQAKANKIEVSNTIQLIFEKAAQVQVKQ